MRSVNKKLQIILAALLGLIPIMVSTGQVYADTKPTFKVEGGDVFAGGIFKAITSCDSSSFFYNRPNYQFAGTFSATKSVGGVLGYADRGLNTGSRSDFGAFAVGLIEGGGANSFGFLSGNASGNKNKLSFANDSSTYNAGDYWGGLFEGPNAQDNCIPDYWDKRVNPPKDVGSGPLDLSDNTRFSGGLGNQYIAGPLAPGATVEVKASSPIANDKKIILFVGGANVYISSNITYAPGYTDQTVPKIAIISQGNMGIAPSVTDLNGWFIAQSSGPSAGDGNFNTCSDVNNPYNFNANWVHDNCTQPLIVKGSVVANKLRLFRVPPASDYTNNTPAETFRLTPEMVIGHPYFGDSITDPGYQIDSVVSLPPVF